MAVAYPSACRSHPYLNNDIDLRSYSGPVNPRWITWPLIWARWSTSPPAWRPYAHARRNRLEGSNVRGNAHLSVAGSVRFLRIAPPISTLTAPACEVSAFENSTGRGHFPRRGHTHIHWPAVGNEAHRIM